MNTAHDLLSLVTDTNFGNEPVVVFDDSTSIDQKDLQTPHDLQSIGGLLYTCRYLDAINPERMYCSSVHRVLKRDVVKNIANVYDFAPDRRTNASYGVVGMSEDAPHMTYKVRQPNGCHKL